MTIAGPFFLGLLMLYFGGEGLVRGTAALGVRFGMSPMVAGLTLVAFATSAPELAIAMDAALRNVPGLAIGNVIGSNSCNIALVLGITALVSPPRVRDSLIRRDVLVMLLSTLFVPALLLDGELSRIEGGLLVLAITSYVGLTVRHAHVSRRRGAAHETLVPILTESIWLNLLLAAGSVTLLVIGSELFVQASIEIAVAIGVPAAVVGLSAAAIGSSLPELSASIIAARHGHPEMAAGNLIGSNIFNLLLILGATSLLRPLSRAGVTLIDLGMMIGVSILALVFMLTSHRVERREGGFLVGIYLLYLVWLFVQP